MKNLIAIVLLAFSLTQSGAQEYKFYPHYGHEYKVTARSGLNLRSKPNLSSPIITKVDYAETVKLEHKDDYGYALIDSIVTESSAKYYSKGFWIKVNHNGVSGFMNTAYLYPVYKNYGNYEIEKTMNQDYVLLKPGFGCRDNIVKGINDFIWYGLYQKGAEVSLKKIKFEFFRSDGEMSDLSVVAKDDKNLNYIIGSKKPLQVGPIVGKMNNHHFFKDEEVSDTLERVSFQNEYCQVKIKGIYHTWQSNKGRIEKYHKLYKVYAHLDGNTQLLNEMGYINWVGDIDQDGYMDYISTVGEKNARTYLYLSSERSKDQIVKPVGVYYSGYCC